MIKIDDLGKTTELSKSSGIKKSYSGESFADYLKTGSTSQTDNLQHTAAMTSADAIFAAQMVNDEEERQKRNKLFKKGNELLDSLEDIRQSLLVGEIDKDKLINISRMVKQKDIETNDPKLQEIIQEIELRVEVELAKLTR